jgi:hypothetical protein
MSPGGLILAQPQFMPTILVCLLGALAVAALPTAQAARTESRAALIAALERLMVTGEPPQTSFDDGQLLQLSIEDAIRNGDAEIERLAVRAATPLVAEVSRPLIEVGQPLRIGIGTRQILKVPQSVPFEAIIYLSADGQDYAEAGTLTSAKGSRLMANLPEHALAVGPHHIRVRARITFSGQPPNRWTEERQLPDVTYAIYDPRSPASGTAPLLFAPAAVSASALDQSLPDLPAGKWLADVSQRAGAKRPVDWMPQYCVERTRKMISPPAGGGDLCAVAGFEAKGDILRAWFRTGSVRFTEAGPVWTVDRPSFLGIDTAGSGTALTRLSALPALLDAPRESWPIADLAIAATDISVEIPRADWAIVTVTVRNNGPIAVHRAHVMVSAGFDPAARGFPPRSVTVDVPANGSAAVIVGTRLPGPYGFIVAQAIQISDMSPHDTWTFDPTPLDACAFRLFNAHLGPPEYARSIDRSSGCIGW